MASLVLTAGAKPIFLGPNLFNRHADRASDLICSKGQSLRHRLYDMDPRAQWTTVEGSSAGLEESIEAGFWDRGVQSLMDFDFFAILGHNLKDFVVEFSANNGADGYPYSYTYSSVASANTLRSLASSLTANRFRIRATQVQADGASPAGVEKKIGTIIIAKSILQMSRGMKVYTQHPPMVRDKTARMHDGSIRRAYIGRSDASLALFGATIGFSGIDPDGAEIVTLRDYLLQSQEPFIFGPEPGDAPGTLKLCQVVPNTYTENYLQLGVRSAGLSVGFDVEEVGGA